MKDVIMPVRVKPAGSEYQILDFNGMEVCKTCDKTIADHIAWLFNQQPRVPLT